ncbi:MAG: hypothetical protein ACOX5L_08055 [Bacteroidales bacterium]|jgi:hypothetical protein
MKSKILFILYFFLIQLQINAQIIDRIIEIPYTTVYVLKHDTVYIYEVYESNKEIDSVKISDTLIRSANGKFWIYQDAYAKYECKFRKKKLSEWFIKYNPIYFNAETECGLKYRKEHILDSYFKKMEGGDIIIYHFYWWGGSRKKVIRK